MELRLLFSWLYSTEITLDFLGDPNKISRVVKCGRERQKSQSQSKVIWERLDSHCWLLKWKESLVNEQGQLWKLEKSTKWIFPLSFQKDSPVETLILVQWDNKFVT